MCRIAGIVDSSITDTELQKNVKAMCDHMAHGGPDDEGFYTNMQGNLSFGHRRLSLIDLSIKAHQPMAYLSNQLFITFNGEIYNFIELRAELMNLGFSFNSESDTEVILAAYAAWGTNSFDKLEGMFAFALFDASEDKTYLVRDCAGIKPLYYCLAKGSLIFASEVKAFKKTTYKFEENQDWKIFFLAFGHIPEPYTTIKEVQMLPKGHYLLWEHKKSACQLKDYQSLKAKTTVTQQQDAINAVNQVLRKAVSHHLISDAPIGVFLSGGIDSSILSILANESPSKKGPVTTVSINFSETQFSEQKYQNIIAKQIRSNHSAFTVNKSIFFNLLPKALSSMDQPSADGINSWFVNYFARQCGIKAVLSGIGADEVFGGYPSFSRMDFVKLLSTLPSFFLKILAKLGKPLFKRAYYLSYKNTVGEYLFLRGIFSPMEIARILELQIDYINEVLSRIPVHCPNHLSGFEKASWLETNMYMQNQLLKDTDCMSMSHGIEVRVPFLDKNLLRLMKNIPAKLKYEKSVPKNLLISSFKNIIDKSIWNRPKMGFVFPFQKWLRHDFNFETVHSVEANKIIRDFKAGKIHWSKAMALHILQKHR